MPFGSHSAGAHKQNNLFSFRFYPKPTGDPGQDRHAHTLQFACFLLVAMVATVAAVDIVSWELRTLPILGMALTGLFAAAILNRQGLWKWGGWTTFAAVLLTAVLLVVQAHDGFRSLAMLFFPGLLLISVMLMDRLSYLATAAALLITVAVLGIAEMHGLTRAVPGVRSPTTYQSLFYVDLILLVFAAVGGRLARDSRSNVSDLRALVSRLSSTNLELTASAEALRDSEAKYRRLYEGIRDAVAAVDMAGRFIETNPAFESMLGYTGEELRRLSYQDVTPVRWHDFESRIVTQQILLNGHSEVYEKELRRRDGTVFPVELRGFLRQDDGGHPIGMWAIIRDITERKRAEAALRESERHLKKAERIAQMGHWHWDLQSNRFSGSDEMYRIFGKPPDYVPSVSGFLDDLSKPDRERFQELIKDSLSRKVGHSIEYQIKRANGDPRTISCVWEVLLDEEGVPVRLFGTCQDITESRRAQEESFVRQKLESVGTLASGIAHDFNNLLGGVLAQAELALDGIAAGSPPEQELKMIRDVALRGSEIVRELMIYAGKDSEVRGLADLSQIAKEMVELLKFSVSKRATLIAEFGQDLPAVSANAAQIRQIVMNLVTNASDALERDGVIRVTTRYGKVPVDSSSALSDFSPDAEYVQLEVSDTGCGMSHEAQARVFDPFFTTKSAGHGLGLAVVSGIVRAVGGTIRLRSELGRGTTVQVLLPSCKSEMAAASHTETNSELLAVPQDMAVLVVEDEDALRQAITKALRKSGFEVIEAAHGSSAIDLLRAPSNKLDVIVLDATIPGASSQEVVAEAAKIRPETRVIVMSAYSPEMITNAVDAPQVVSFIRKPFRIGDLIQTIRNAPSVSV